MLTVVSVRVRLTASVLATLVFFVPRPSWSAWTSDPTVNLSVCALATAQQWPKISTDNAGGAIVTWQDARTGSSNIDIYAQHVTATGVADANWPANGRALCTAAGQQMFPFPASDGAGGAIISWQDLRNVATGNDIFAQHVQGNGVVDPLWPANGQLLCSATGDQTNPVVMPDGTGGAIVVWQDQRAGNFDLYAQHVLGNGTVDPAWPVNGLGICTAVGNQLGPRLVPDGAGGAIVSWQDQRSGDFDIYAQRVKANGTVDPAWTANGSPLCVIANAQQVPTIASDGSGGAIVAWQDFRNGVEYDVFAQHVLASGAVDPVWPANGRQLAANAADQVSPTILSDGAGGGLVVWQDTRNVGTTGRDIFAMRVLANGTLDPAWPANGLPLCLAPGDQENLVAISDKTGGMIAGWQDRRVGYDIYAQHVSAAGVVDPAWPVNGSALSTATSDQLTPMLVPDGVGGAIATWQDLRNGVDLDIYAQRVQPNGALGGDVVGVTESPSLSLAPISPNPARGRVPRVDFALETGGPATLECLDVTGRRVAVQEVGWLGPGRHSLDLVSGQRLRPGLYWLRLRQGSALAVRRVVLLD